MRWLIALGLTLAFAGAAQAQSPTVILCARYDDAWAKVGGGSDLHQMEAVERSIPAICPVKSQAERRITAVKAQTSAKLKPEPVVVAPMETSPPPPPEPAENIAPLDPCSAAAIDAQDPGIPSDGPDPGLAPKKRQDLAQRYARRAQAYLVCHDTSDGLAYLNIAVKEDPQNFSVAAARAAFYASQNDEQDAIADYGTAIALQDHAPPEVNILSVYAARASVYHALKMYPQEIGDLKMVVDHFNDALHDTLQSFASYKERLAKAYYQNGDADDAEALFAVIDPGDLDWEDLWFLGRIRAEGKIWDGAIDAMTKAIDAMPPHDGANPVRSTIEAALGAAYQSRGQPGDQRSAWDAYQAALADNPNNPGAKAALAGLGTMLPAPTFQDPALDPVVMPAGVSNLDQDSPAPFCGQEDKNDYLDTIKTASNTVNSDMETLGMAIDALLKQRAVYDASPLLTYSEKIADLNLFDAQFKHLDAYNTALRAEGDALLRFFSRVRDDDKLVAFCRGK